MRRTRRFLSTSAIAAMIGISAGGCGVTADTTIADALRSFAENPLLSQITVGDVVQGFNDFLAGTGNEAPALTETQQGQLRNFQAQFDAGEISEADFEAYAESMSGFGGGFAGHSSMFGRLFRHGPLTGDLALTDEQRTQVREILLAAHDDIHALREAAHEEIYNDVLTDEQRAILDEMRANRQPIVPEDADDTDESVDAAARGPGQGFGIGRHGFGPGGRRPAMRPFRARLAERLELTEEQLAQIDEIRATLRADVRARHEQAREEFRAILTEEQLAALDEFIANHPRPGHHGHDDDVDDDDDSNDEVDDAGDDQDDTDDEP